MRLVYTTRKNPSRVQRKYALRLGAHIQPPYCLSHANIVRKRFDISLQEKFMNSGKKNPIQVAYMWIEYRSSAWIITFGHTYILSRITLIFKFSLFLSDKYRWQFCTPMPMFQKLFNLIRWLNKVAFVTLSNFDA